MTGSSSDRSAGTGNFARFCRYTVLLLMLEVPFLSTVAKASSYVPSSPLGHYISASTKMEVDSFPIIYDLGLPAQIINLIPPRPQVRSSRQAEPEPDIRSISV